MKTRFFSILKIVAKSVLYLVLAMIVLITFNEVSESRWFDPRDGGFWKVLCSEQIALQADHDEAIYYGERSEKYRANSPKGDKIIIEYEILDRDNFYPYDLSYLGGKNVLAVQKTDIGQPSEKYIYIGQENIRNSQWLDNDHIFFTADCGTNCETLYLLNAETKELRVGKIEKIIATSPYEWRTTFIDWHGKKFVFNNEVNIIRAEIKDNSSYLIFELGNGWNDNPPIKRFLFTRNSLVANELID